MSPIDPAALTRVLSSPWVWVMAALPLGILVGWLTYSGGEVKAGSRWSVAISFVLIAALAFGIVSFFPREGGFWLESALLLGFAYTSGCAIGYLAKREALQKKAPKPPAPGAAPAMPAEAGSAGAPGIAATPVATAPAAEEAFHAHEAAAAPMEPTLIAVADTDPAAPPREAPPPIPYPPAEARPSHPEPEPEPRRATPPPLDWVAAAMSLADAETVARLAAHPGERPSPATTAMDEATGGLSLVWGLGRDRAAMLRSIGVRDVGQMALWTPENVAWIESFLSCPGQVEAEAWIAQARVIAAQRDQRRDLDAVWREMRPGA